MEEKKLEKQPGEVNVLMIVLSYLGILSLIPFSMEKDDEFIQYHAKQGLTLFIFEIIAIVAFIIIDLIPFVGCVLFIVEIFFWLAVLVYHIIIILKAVKGEKVVIPYISDTSKKWFK